MPNIKVQLPSVHMAGSNAHCEAHIEVGQHGFALFLAPDAEYPVLDITGTSEQLDAVLRALQSALALRSAPNGNMEPASEMKPHRAPPGAEPAPTRSGGKAALTLVHPSTP
jgi:hypothetical protein